MIQYRYYAPGDEAAIVQLWNDVLRRDPINPERFRNLVLLDGNFDPEGMRLAFAHDRLVGCVYAVRRLTPLSGTELEPDNGWIPFFFVDKEFERQGIGEALMKQAFEFLKKHGRKHVFFASYAPNYILPGIDVEAYESGWDFLQQMGFEKLYSPVAMDRDLVGYALPDDVRQLKMEREAEGYTFETAKDSDLVELIQFANDAFNPDWGRAIRVGILSGLPLEWIFVARAQGKLVGFCLHGAYEGIPERFGPFGVDEEQRGKSLGKILLHICLTSMRAQGLHGAWFLWTGEKSAAGHLYTKAGFTITRRFHVCKKELE